MLLRYAIPATSPDHPRRRLADQYHRPLMLYPAARIGSPFYRPDIRPAVLELAIHPAIPPVPDPGRTIDQLPPPVVYPEKLQAADADRHRPEEFVGRPARRKSIRHKNIRPRLK